MDVTPPPAPNAEEHRFPCAQCGADLRYAPEQGALVCDHCGFREAISEGPSGTIRETAFTFDAGNLPDDEMEETRVLSCPNCGAQVEFAPSIHAAECPFCATPVVTDTGTHRHIKPRAVIPFALDEGAARKAMNDWLGRLWFAPNGLQAYARKGRRMQGIYVPFWTFDADTASDYTGERGTVYYETRTVRRNGETRTERVQKIRWHPVAGHVARFFDDVLVLASQSLPQRHTDALEPWDLSALAPYRPEYLAGFRAEGYTVDLQEGYNGARVKMDRVIQRDIRFDIGGDRQRIHHVDTQVSDVTYKHILLPIWLAAYRYRGKAYRFVVNAQTGRVQGERPWSAWKIAFAVILALIIAGTVGYFAAQQG